VCENGTKQGGKKKQTINTRKNGKSERKKSPKRPKKPNLPEDTLQGTARKSMGSSCGGADFPLSSKSNGVSRKLGPRKGKKKGGARPGKIEGGKTAHLK